MHIVFCADRGVLPGLHVAAYSLLDRMSPAAGTTCFTVFSDALDEADIGLLADRRRADKPFTLELHKVQASVFAGFPSLNGSWATYYRLHAAQVMAADRFLYVDADTLCDLDVSELHSLDMRNRPAGWVRESPLPQSVDRGVADNWATAPVNSISMPGSC